MRTKTKLTALITATAAFSAIAFEAMPATFVKASETTETTSEFYMEAGAAVNLDDDSYGGIRWTTNVTAGYNPFSSADAADVTFGAFVVPTSTYEAQKAEKAIAEMDGAVKVKSGITADALAKDTSYTSAIKYDDIIDDYEEKYGEQSEEQITALLTKAYQMELTAVSYAEYNGEYVYADATETSRSARQVANAAILVNDSAYDGASEERKAQVASYVETGASEFKRTTLTNENEGYLDLTELNAETVTAQEIDVSAFECNFSNVAEVLLGGKKITGYTYKDGVLSVTEGSEAFKKTYDTTVKTKYEYNQTWLSVFTTDGKVYSLPLIPADGVIRTADDLNDTFLMRNKAPYVSGGCTECKQKYAKCKQHTYEAEDATCATCGNSEAECTGEEHTYAATNAKCTTCELVEANCTQHTYNEYKWDITSLYGYYVLGANISACTLTAGEYSNGGIGATYSDIVKGKTEGGFYGTFDGRGRVITDLTTRIGGIFGWLFNATVKNVAIEATQLTQNSACLLASYSYNTVLENVYVSLTQKKNGVGCLFRGVTSSNTVTNCLFVVNNMHDTAKGSVTNSDYAWVTKTGYGASSYDNTYVISTAALGINSSVTYDAINWMSDGRTITDFGNIYRYESLADMLNDVTYSYKYTVDDDGNTVADTTTVVKTNGTVVTEKEIGSYIKVSGTEVLWNGAAL